MLILNRKIFFTFKNSIIFNIMKYCTCFMKTFFIPKKIKNKDSSAKNMSNYIS